MLEAANPTIDWLRRLDRQSHAAQIAMSRRRGLARARRALRMARNPPRPSLRRRPPAVDPYAD